MTGESEAMSRWPRKSAEMMSIMWLVSIMWQK